MTPNVKHKTSSSLDLSFNLLLIFPQKEKEEKKIRMASRDMLIIISVVTTTLLGLAVATDHTIGGPSGWTVGASLRTWAAGQTFAVGDNLGK